MNQARQRMWLYGFKAARIQAYILSSRKLRDIQGASQLLEELCGERFDRAREAAGLPADAVLSQAAGGARVLSADEDAVQRLMAIWPAVAEELAPGVQVEQARVEVEPDMTLADAQRLLGQRLQESRSEPAARLPEITPMVRRNPRTGEPAIRLARFAGEQEPLDRITDAKRRCWERMRKAGGEWNRAGGRLEERFLGEGSDLRFVRGEEANEEFENREGRYVGLLHVDGNAVGAAIDRVLGAGSAAAEGEGRGRFQAFSKALSAATVEAARDTVREVLAPHADRRSDRDGQAILPARPIVLGGDDLTILLAAEHAFDFAEVFVEAFERRSTEKLGALAIPGVEGLTACAGLAIVKPSFPFDQAHDLAESLCGLAKRHAKARAREPSGAIPSAISFHRVTTSLVDDAATVVARELSGPDVRLTMEAYGLGAIGGGLPPFQHLETLAHTTRGLPRGSLRELVTAMQGSASRATALWRRVREVERGRSGEGREGPFARFQQTLGLLTGDAEKLWTEGADDGVQRSPLGDALLLARLTRAQRMPQEN